MDIVCQFKKLPKMKLLLIDYVTLSKRICFLINQQELLSMLDCYIYIEKQHCILSV